MRAPRPPRRGRTPYLRAWARRKRDELIALLGGARAVCGSWDQLEFDHPHGRDWVPRKLSRWQRMIRYRRDYDAGNLRLLCKPHNSADGARFRGRR